MKAVVTIVLVIVLAYMPCVSPWYLFHRRRCHHSPPVLSGHCHRDVHTHADACSNSTVVRWTSPSASASHRRCGGATVRRVDCGPNSGNRFNVHESPYFIKYSATDAHGMINRHLCCFKISVKERSCPTHPSVSGGRVSCSCGNLYGSACNIKCANGYYITRGNDRRICQHKRTWSGVKPSCTPIQCPDPYPNLPDNSTNCTDGYKYNSVCSYICPPGYSLLSSSKRACKACKTWTGSENPVCNDTQRPVINCPGTILAFAESGQTTATVTWDLPTVTDNSNEVLTAELIEGLPPGADFSSGSLAIKYEVSDSNGNTARCSFSVVVQVIQCPALSLLPGQRMMCTSQFHYGSVCQFQCSSGFVLNGSDTNECLRQGANDNNECLRQGANDTECLRQGANDTNECLRQGANDTKECLRQGANDTKECLRQGANDTNECLRQRANTNEVWSAPQPTCEDNGRVWLV